MLNIAAGTTQPLDEIIKTVGSTACTEGQADAADPERRDPRTSAPRIDSARSPRVRAATPRRPPYTVDRVTSRRRSHLAAGANLGTRARGGSAAPSWHDLSIRCGPCGC